MSKILKHIHQLLQLMISCASCRCYGLEPHAQPLYRYIFFCIITFLPTLLPSSHFNCQLPTANCQLKKVEDIGVEPMTPCVQGRCSSQLS